MIFTFGRHSGACAGMTVENDIGMRVVVAPTGRHPASCYSFASVRPCCFWYLPFLSA